MSQTSQPGVFVFSIDVTAPRETAAARRPTAAACAVAVAEHLAKSRLPVTWALDFEANAELACELAAAESAHEIALLGHRSWAGLGVERSLVAAEFERRVGGAAAGHRPRTLVLTDGPVTEHLDLLVKHGFTAVRTESRSRRTNEAQGRGGWLRRARGADALPSMHSLRWGLWEIGHSLDLVGHRPRGLTMAIDAIAAQGGLAHLVLELSLLEGNVSAGLKLVDRIAAQVAGWQAQGRIEALTVAGLTARLARVSRQSPARSILRPAA